MKAYKMNISDHQMKSWWVLFYKKLSHERMLILSRGWNIQRLKPCGCTLVIIRSSFSPTCIFQLKTFHTKFFFCTTTIFRKQLWYVVRYKHGNTSYRRCSSPHQAKQPIVDALDDCFSNVNNCKKVWQQWGSHNGWRFWSLQLIYRHPFRFRGWSRQPVPCLGSRPRLLIR